MSARILIGVVTSIKNEKTVVVSVESTKKHPIYGKRFLRHKKFQVDKQEIVVSEGDNARIMECAPVSKTKNFKLIEVLNK